jgi:two-component system response regulator AtoC
MNEGFQRRVLVIDDERDFGELLEILLTRDGYTVEYVSRGADGLARLESGAFDIVICDVTMPGMNGLEFLQKKREMSLSGTVVMMSAYGTIETAIECMKLGAYDYISKPFKSDELLLSLRKLEEREGLRRENRRLKEALDRGHRFEEIVGRSPVMQRLFTVIDRVAEYPSTVLVSGESGTGKELVARAIHRLSDRSSERFVTVNCGAIPESLLESELFGFVKGAFTDAHRDKPGMFSEAHKGTLFLDEIGELPLSLQVKVLRALQEQEIRPVGSSRTLSVDVRIVAATNRNLKEEVAQRRFREDLFYRLNVLPISLPPLRERAEDIPDLVHHFLERSTERLGKRVRYVEPDAMQRLMMHSWPGNIRELENTIERACVFADGDTITTEVLPEALKDSADRVRLTLLGNELSIKKTTRIIEEELISRALRQTGGNRTAASKLLEISHRALLYKIKEYGINIPPRGT